MLGTFLGLETSLRGLEAAQAGMDTVSHNIDNASTPGYSREQVQMSEATSLDVAGSPTIQVGQGVNAEQVTRITNDYLNAQYRDQNATLSQANTEQSTLNQISDIIDEPSDTGISNAMDEFWSAWDTLGSNPSQLSDQTSVISAGQTLTSVMNQTANQLSDLQGNITASLSDSVNEVNSVVSQIATVSDQIKQAQEEGTQPNDLMDQRDELLDQLSQYTSFTTSDVSTSQDAVSYDQFSLSIGGVTVIDGTQPIGTKPGQLSFDSTNNSISVSSSDGSQSAILQNQAGEIQGYQDSLTDIGSYQTQLNSLASNLATGQMTVSLLGDWQVPVSAASTSSSANYPSIVMDDGSTETVSQYIASQGLQPSNGQYTIPAGTSIVVNGLNGLMQMGYSEDGPGAPFFTTSDGSSTITASNIQVGTTEQQLASATTYDPSSGSAEDAVVGDGTLATLVSNVKDASMQFVSPSSSGGTTTSSLDGYLTAVVGQIGMQGQQVNNTVSSQQTVVNQLENQRESVSGVSIDEETANMISYQQAYNASAEVIQTINQMLSQLMSDTQS